MPSCPVLAGVQHRSIKDNRLISEVLDAIDCNGCSVGILLACDLELRHLSGILCTVIVWSELISGLCPAALTLFVAVGGIPNQSPLGNHVVSIGKMEIAGWQRGEETAVQICRDQNTDLEIA